MVVRRMKGGQSAACTTVSSFGEALHKKLEDNLSLQTKYKRVHAELQTCSVNLVYHKRGGLLLRRTDLDRTCFSLLIYSDIFSKLTLKNIAPNHRQSQGDR